MLKATFPPMLSTLCVKPRSRNSSIVFRNVFTNSPSPVRENVPTDATPSYQLPPTSAYIHLPFCRKRCHYCDFPVVALGSYPNDSHDDDPRIIDYIQLLCREILVTRLDFEQRRPLKTVFFGGGTPSLVPPKLVSMVLETLRSNFGVCWDAEISMEMDPGTFGGGKLREFIGLGVNRVSLGVQAFQEELLKSCGRAHSVKEVYEAIEIVKSCGIENWSMDLISSLPHQTPQMWDENLSLTIEAKPAHVSVYDLQVEQGTKFGLLYSPGEFPLPSETESAELYKMASRALSGAGYDHYEISSYCKGGFQCKHNLTYWENRSFYGFGLGSASYVHGMRFSRPRRMSDYRSYVQNLEVGLANQCENSDVDLNDRAMDVVMLSLRTARGLDIKSFAEAFGAPLVKSLCQAYTPYVESGHVVFLDEQRKLMSADGVKSSLTADECKSGERLAFIRLSDPDGFLLSNELISVAFGIIAP